MVAGSEKMLGVFFSNSGFKCCACSGTHRRLQDNNATRDCYFSLVNAVGGHVPYAGRRRIRYSGGTPTASWRPMSLSRVLWPDHFKDDDLTLDLSQYKHALAADTNEDGLAFLKSVIEDWKASLNRKEQELWSTSSVPSVYTADRCGTLSIGSPVTRTTSELSDYQTASLLMKDLSVARLLTVVANGSMWLDLEWPDVTKPAKLLFRFGNAKEADMSGVYLLSNERRLKFIPVDVKTVKEAEFVLETSKRLTKRIEQL